MSDDKAVQVVNQIDYRMPQKILPAYLISLDAKKDKNQFIAIKYDETANCAKVVGFYVTLTEDEIASTHLDIIKTMDKSKVVELLIPWNKINYVRSLTYKQK